ncbi:MAG: hypothetical protein ACFHU9_14800 [Fluviicola sp.]
MQWNFNQRNSEKSEAAIQNTSKKLNATNDVIARSELNATAEDEDKKIVPTPSDPSRSTSHSNEIKPDEAIALPPLQSPTGTSDTHNTKREKPEEQETIYREWHSAVPLTVAGLGIIAFFIIALTSGYIPLLIPIGLTILAALITYLVIQEGKKKRDAAHPRQQLLNFALVVAVIWITASILIFTSINPIYTITVFLFLFFGVFIVIANKREHERRNAPKTPEASEETQKTDVDPENATIHEEEDMQNQPKVTVYKPPLSAATAFPGLTAAGVLLIILGLVIGFFMFLIAAFVGFLGGTIAGPIVYFVLVPIAMIIGGIIMFVQRGQLYREYLQDYRQGPTEKSETIHKESVRKNKNVAALMLMAFLLILVIAIAVLILL